jgi:hypothetical protein
VPFWHHFSGLEHKLHGALHAHQHGLSDEEEEEHVKQVIDWKLL